MLIFCTFIYVQKEQENDSTVYTEFEKLSKNYHQDPTLLEEITPESTESDIELSSLDIQELNLSAASKSASAYSVSKNLGSSISTDMVEISSMVEKGEDELNTVEKLLLSGHNEENQSLISAEPSK
jgi:hypothetical protein